MQWIAPVHPNVNNLTTNLKQAIDNVAGFICVGMFDFHPRENAIIARNAIANAAARRRSRPRHAKYLNSLCLRSGLRYSLARQVV